VETVSYHSSCSYHHPQRHHTAAQQQRTPDSWCLLPQLRATRTVRTPSSKHQLLVRGGVRDTSTRPQKHQKQPRVYSAIAGVIVRGGLIARVGGEKQPASHKTVPGAAREEHSGGL
jgi:hypothetical protein